MITFLQILLTLLACAGLWRFWSSLQGRGASSLVISAGFLIRAVAGQVLFWISWLHLPVAPSLHSGGGYWFFAPDAPGYLQFAGVLIDQGFRATVLISSAYTSRTFTQVLTAFAAAFGLVEPIAILLNCVAYLAACALILRIASRDPRAETPRLVMLAAISFGPATVLWSLQPLKDTFFFMLIIAMLAAFARWQELWRSDGRVGWRPFVWCGAMMTILVYVIAGTRWYFAAIICVASVVFLTMASIPAHHRWRALGASAVLLLALSQAFRLGGNDDVPVSIRRLVDPMPGISRHRRPLSVARYIVESRRGFESTPAATMIIPGPALGAPAGSLRPAARTHIPRSSFPTSRQFPATDTSLVSPSAAWQKDAVVDAARKSLWRTTATGFVAMFVPRVLAQSLGLLHIGGGRGFWLFVELDTLVFDAVLLFSFVHCVRALRSRARITPLFIFVLLLLLMTAAPMMYTVTNFGTLFRLRQMVYILGAMLPLALARDPRDGSQPS
jgi:hypothetical protein